MAIQIIMRRKELREINSQIGKTLSDIQRYEKGSIMIKMLKYNLSSLMNKKTKVKQIIQSKVR